MPKRGRTSRIRVMGAVLGLVGGVLIVLGVLAPWIRSQGVSVGAVAVPANVRGVDVSLGLLAAAAGAVTVTVALVVLLTPRRAARLLGAGLIVSSLAAGVVVLVHVADPDQAYIDFAIAQANDAGESTKGADESLHQLIKGSTLDVELGWGLWITAGGAVLALVGGCLVLLTGSRPVATRSARRLDEPAQAEPGLPAQPQWPGFGTGSGALVTA